MHMPKTLISAFVTACLIPLAPCANAAPFTPATDSEVVERLPTSRSDAKDPWHGLNDFDEE